MRIVIRVKISFDPENVKSNGIRRYHYRMHWLNQ
jgi:hypothetical protein